MLGALRRAGKFTWTCRWEIDFFFWLMTPLITVFSNFSVSLVWNWDFMTRGAEWRNNEWCSILQVYISHATWALWMIVNAGWYSPFLLACTAWQKLFSLHCFTEEHWAQRSMTRLSLWGEFMLPLHHSSEETTIPAADCRLGVRQLDRQQVALGINHKATL